MESANYPYLTLLSAHGRRRFNRSNIKGVSYLEVPEEYIQHARCPILFLDTMYLIWLLFTVFWGTASEPHKLWPAFALLAIAQREWKAKHGVNFTDFCQMSIASSGPPLPERISSLVSPERSAHHGLSKNGHKNTGNSLALVRFSHFGLITLDCSSREWRVLSNSAIRIREVYIWIDQSFHKINGMHYAHRRRFKEPSFKFISKVVPLSDSIIVASSW